MKERSQLRYKQIVVRMNIFITQRGYAEGMTRNTFDAKFRRFANRESVYSTIEVIALINAFEVKDEPIISAVEATLLVLWSNVGLSVNEFLIKLYGQETYMFALMICSLNAQNLMQINWSQVEVRERTLEDLNQQMNRSKNYFDFTGPKTIAIDFPIHNNSLLHDSNFQGLVDGATAIENAIKSRKLGNLENAKNILMQALQLSLDYQREAEAKHQLGIIATETSHYVLADEYLHQAQTLATQYHYIEVPAILANRGTNEFMRGNFSQAKEFYNEGLRVAKDNHNSKVLNYIHNSLAILLSEEGNYTGAEAYYREALDNAYRHSNYRGIVFNHAHLGLMYYYQGQKDRSIEEYNLSIDLLQHWEDLQLRIQVGWYYHLLQLVKFATSVGERAREEQQLWEAQRASRIHNLVWHDLSIRLDLANYYLHNNRRKARHQYETIIDIVSEHHEPDRLAIALFGKAIMILDDKSPSQIHTPNELANWLRESFKSELNYSERLHDEQINRAARYFQRGLVYSATENYPITESLKLLFCKD